MTGHGGGVEIQVCDDLVDRKDLEEKVQGEEKLNSSRVV